MVCDCFPGNLSKPITRLRAYWFADSGQGSLDVRIRVNQDDLVVVHGRVE